MIRVAEEGDAPEISLLCGQLGYPAAPREIQGRLRRMDARETGRVYVAEDEGRVVGWLQVLALHALTGPPSAVVTGLVVDAAARGRGLGRQLMEAAERWTVMQGFDRVRVRSNVVREETHRFYQDLGYDRIKSQAVFEKRLTAPVAGPAAGAPHGGSR